MVLADLRYAFRRLLAAPGFTIAVVLTLAIGIGANVLVADLVDGVYFRALPYRDDASLVYIEDSNTRQGPDADNGMISIPDYLDRRRDVGALADSALYLTTDLNLSGVGAPERLRAIRTTPSLFTTLGVAAALGRTFTDDEATVGRDKVVVLSDPLWRKRFNAAPDIVGRDLDLSGERYRIIGVMPPSFLFPTRDAEVFVPYAFTADDLKDSSRFTGFAQGIGRLAPGATVADVKAEADLVIRRNAERIGASGAEGNWYKAIVEANGYTIKATPLRDYFAGARVRELPLLQLAVALVLLIVCANVANLLLVRASARQKELAVRAVLGAGRARIARQHLVEALMLALTGGALGLAFAVAGGRVVAASGLLPDFVDIAPRAGMLATALALSLVAGLLFGTLPILARQKAASQVGTLRESGRLASGGRGARAVRDSLVVAQLALAVALLASAGLLLRSFGKILQQDPGFRSEHVLTAKIMLPDTKYPDDAAQARAFERIVEEVRRVSGVASAGLTTTLPFSGTNAGQMFRIVGREADGGVQRHAALRRIDEGYFAAMGIPLRQGRAFARSDWNADSHDVIVDELFARKHFPDGNAVGSTLLLGSSGESDTYTIVGVVGTVRHGNLAADVSKETFYFDFGARPNASAYLAVRTTVAPSALVEPLRAAVRGVDADQPLFDVATLDERIDRSLAGRRVPMQLIGLFAAVALVLSAIGIYGVLAFAVAQRTGEFGVRMAIGADPSRIRRDVLGGGARLAAIGLGLGIGGALALGTVLRSQLFGIGIVDPPSLAAVVAILAATALIACWLPARRASRTAPVAALRYE